MIKILIVCGTRPEVIKVAPVIKEFKKFPKEFVCKVCITGQHREMVDSLLKLFDVKVDYDLNLMKANQNLEHITTTVLHEIGKIIEGEKFDYLLVQGDTTTAMAASLAAFYKRVKIGHIEAGLRTWNKFHPYPEEVNRKIIDSVSDLYFAHTDAAKKNLVNEGVDPKAIEVTGNTVIDALLDTARSEFSFKGTDLERVVTGKPKIILVTAHRRENAGEPILNICAAMKEIALRFKDEVTFVYPVHLNPNIKVPVNKMLQGVDNIILTAPMDYLPFVHLMKHSYFVLTDSGGIQEEAPTLGIPVLVMREVTERSEGIDAGTAKLVGVQRDSIIMSVVELLENKVLYNKMATAINPYGDGTTSTNIMRILKELMTSPPKRPTINDTASLGLIKNDANGYY